MSDIRTFEDLLKGATNFKAGDYPVTCPNCQTSGRTGKFCTVCGNPITAVNYDTIVRAVSSGKLSQEELLETLNTIPEFRKGTEASFKMLEKMKEQELILE